MAASVSIELDWRNGTRLEGRAGEVETTLDWEGEAAPSPVQFLAFALAGCMAADVVLLLTRGRLLLQGLRVRLDGERAQADPRRLVRVSLGFEVRGAVPADRVERAIALSRERYCSVWHSLRPDIELTTTFAVLPSADPAKP